MDIAGLSKLTADTLVLIVSILGFMVIIFFNLGPVHVYLRCMNRLSDSLRKNSKLLRIVWVFISRW